MSKIRRKLEPILLSQLKREKSILLLGPRQVGKTTLLQTVPNDLTISLLENHTRLQFEKDPDRIAREVIALPKRKGSQKPLIIIDEIQKVPALLDPIQKLIDESKASFILTGSSARKLKRQGEINLLPGRVVQLRLDPLSLLEIEQPNIKAALLDGSLPSIFLTKNESDRELDLQTYVETYLNEEVRSEALVRKMGEFAKFLELAGIESGRVLNSSKISQDLGISSKTVAAYFEILEDCLIAERIEPIAKSLTRKKLTKSCRYLLFDLGVRRLCANEGTRLTPERIGELFEQFIGLELVRILRILKPTARLRFWRDPDGPEVDWVVEDSGHYLPIEVKWTESPKPKDIKNLQIFMDEYPTAKTGFLVCRVPRRQKLADFITAVPWQELPNLLKE